MPMPLLAASVAASLAAALAPAAAPATAPGAVPSARTTTAVTWTPYTVRAGDTAYVIARRTGTTLSTLVAANSLPAGGSLIHVGQRLLVPTAPTTTPPSTPSTPRPGAPTPSAPAPTVSRSEARALVERTAGRYGVDQRLALAIATQESSFRQDVRSNVGAVGIMQVMPANAGWLSGLAGRRLDLTVAEDNVTAGVLLLRHLVTHAPSLDHAIGGYYQGLPSIVRRGAYPDTLRYITSVKGYMAVL